MFGKHEEAAVEMHTFLDLMEGQEVAVVSDVSIMEHAKRKLRLFGDDQNFKELIERMEHTLARFKDMLVTQRNRVRVTSSRCTLMRRVRDLVMVKDDDRVDFSM